MTSHWPRSVTLESLDWDCLYAVHQFLGKTEFRHLNVSGVSPSAQTKSRKLFILNLFFYFGIVLDGSDIEGECLETASWTLVCLWGCLVVLIVMQVMFPGVSPSVCVWSLCIRVLPPCLNAFSMFRHQLSSCMVGYCKHMCPMNGQVVYCCWSA